ncbi:MAG: hypothetical protein GF317_04140 [Candidatus Lokiarchaeota archaeon]|nr:hypothetical protein [Candidatus Lokiarchaeota archaeon]MBD3199077.1 hypothetical protein [Candidatus Lokiarchaeota archaeon]
MTDYWDIVDGIYNTTFTLFFFVLAFLMFYISLRSYKNNRYGSLSTIICVILFIIFGYYNSIFGFLLYPYNGFMIWWIGISLLIFFSFAFIISRKINKMSLNEGNLDITETDSSLTKYVKRIRKKDPYRERISFKMEVIRKSFHLTGILLILIYFGFFFIPPLTLLINDAVLSFVYQTQGLYQFFWGNPSVYPYSFGDFQAVIDLTMFGLIGALFFMIISDLIRVLWGPEYSMFNFLTRSILRNKEYNAVGPQIYLVTGAVFSYLLYVVGWVDVLIVYSGLLIACFSDAIAALVGRRFGNHEVECIGGETKTIEGFIAGIACSYLIGLFTVGPFYSLVATLIFFLLDYFPLRIADNILNPIMITIVLGFLSYFIGFPIGIFN